ncbi:MAG: hypothetical protein NVSMB29_03720 [Candidatus Dormibacteria bacterium]
MPEPSTPRSPGSSDLLAELERLVPDLPTATLLELGARLDDLMAEERLQPDEVERALTDLLVNR